MHCILGKEAMIMNKKILTICALAGTLLVGSVASAANWNGLANYPEVPNSANGSETYYFDKTSQFKEIDGSRNIIFGINVVTMHDNQYGEVTLFKYIVHPSLHSVYRFTPDGQSYEITPGTNEYNMFLATYKEVYGVDLSFPDMHAVPATLSNM